MPSNVNMKFVTSLRPDHWSLSVATGYMCSTAFMKMYV